MTKTRTNEQARRRAEETARRWEEHFWQMKTDPAYRRRFERQPPIIVLAYPKLSNKKLRPGG